MPSGGRLTALGEVGSAVAGTITDSTQNFTPNGLIDSVLYFPESGEAFTVISNTATTLTFNGAYVPEVGTPYAVKESFLPSNTTSTSTANGATGIVYTYLPLYMDPAPAPAINTILVHQ